MGVRNFNSRGFAEASGGSSSLDEYADFASLPASADDLSVAITLDTLSPWKYHASLGMWYPLEYGEGGTIVLGDTGDTLDLDAATDTVASAIAGDWEQAYATLAVDGAGFFDFDATGAGTNCGLRFFTAVGELDTSHMYSAYIEWATNPLVTTGGEGFMHIAVSSGVGSYLALDGANTMSFLDSAFQPNFGGTTVGRMSMTDYDPIYASFNYKLAASEPICQAFVPGTISRAVRVPLSGQVATAFDRYIWIYASATDRIRMRRFVVTKWPNPAPSGIRGR